ncbi:MAG: FAD-binding oxidoreductase [Granulosicoccus sp.]|nr:FAD-binding oxidoreductase [Granulosicoccus sp.]
MTAVLVDTWYRGCVPERTPVQVDGTRSTGVCIIGAGLAGLNCARELMRHGHQVVVLEAEQVAWGASGRNGGFVAPGYALEHAAIEARAGSHEARILHGMSIEGLQMVADNIRSLGIPCAEAVDGILSVRRYRAAAELKARRDWLAEEFGYTVDYLDRAALSELLQTTRYHEALHDRQAFHINPLGYARGLANAVHQQGGEIFEQCPVTAIDGRRGDWQVVTDTLEVQARDVVIATGGYTGRLSTELYRSYLPIATYVMSTQADPELLATAIGTRSAIFDDRLASDYYRLIDDGRRLLWGGGITTRTTQPRALSRMLQRSMTDIFPQLAGLEVDMAWSGLMSYARHRMPQIGQLGSGIWYCTAFGGHGLNTTAIGGRVVAEAITGHSERYRHFQPFGLDYTAGLIGRAAVQATYWRYRLLDAWRERASASC